ncbi:MAG: regulatory signaling modulator protein AmpE [Gammaproteobacteria bacterium]
MSLIVILLSLGIERFLGSVEDYRRFEWFEAYADWVYARMDGMSLRDGPVGVIAIMVPVILVVWAINELAYGLTPVFAFLFAIGVVLYAIGPKDLYRDAEGYLDAMERGDQEGGAWYAAEMLERDVTGTPAEVAQTMTNAVLVKSTERLLGVLFWFVLAGPVGAILYRLACVARAHTAGQDSGLARSMDDLYMILLWPVARLTMLSYAVSGSFVEAFNHWRSVSELWQWDSEELLVSSGRGALRLEPRPEAPEAEQEADIDSVRDALGLVRRTVIVWLTVLALLTLTGWAS